MGFAAAPLAQAKNHPATPRAAPEMANVRGYLTPVSNVKIPKRHREPQRMRTLPYLAQLRERDNLSAQTTEGLSAQTTEGPKLWPRRAFPPWAKGGAICLNGDKITTNTEGERLGDTRGTHWDHEWELKCGYLNESVRWQAYP